MSLWIEDGKLDLPRSIDATKKTQSANHGGSARCLARRSWVSTITTGSGANLVAFVSPTLVQQEIISDLVESASAGFDFTNTCAVDNMSNRKRAGRGFASSSTPQPADHLVSGSVPPRPGFGNLGRKCYLKANHFLAELDSKDLHQYDVSITPDSSAGVNRAVMNSLVQMYKISELGSRLPAYDGRKILYTAGPLPFPSKDFEITLIDEDDSSQTKRKQRKFKVSIKYIVNTPQDDLQALNIVLRQLPVESHFPVGRSFYYPNGERISLGGGLESWHGFYQSMRQTQMGLSLNIDTSSTAFIQPLPVIDFVSVILNRRARHNAWQLSNAECKKVEKALKGIKIQVTHSVIPRKYRISGLTSDATKNLIFPVGESTKKVVDYFEEAHGYKIIDTNLPCLKVGGKETYLPIEVCNIVKGQRYSKKLNETQMTNLLRESCQNPSVKERDILQAVHYHSSDDLYAQEFGISISQEPADIQGRILDPPKLVYSKYSGEPFVFVPKVGQWNMMGKMMMNGGTARRWTCINFAQLHLKNEFECFCKKLAQTCWKYGMDILDVPVHPLTNAGHDQVRRVLNEKYAAAMRILEPKGEHLDLLIVILPDKNGTLYGDVKRICETEIGLITQCCLASKVLKNKNSELYLSNISLKINAKVGGTNTVLNDAISYKIPLVTDKHTIIFGADVTHPNRGEDSSPSIAAVVASQDWPSVAKYASLVSAQANRKEVIQDLYTEWQDPRLGTLTGGMIKELINSYKSTNGKMPERIIFYRDGVGEGQFKEVLLFELEAIKKACASLSPNYQPPITFIVVQKRHHTKLFPTNEFDRTGNILAGTVVDSFICHPTEFDFYLCSHAGVQGTSRPTHYHVLHDDNKFSANQLQKFTYDLCYTYARCTRSVSIVPPAYYAHLAAYRARFYMAPVATDSGSVENREDAVRPLLAVRDNVKRVMYYC